MGAPRFVIAVLTAALLAAVLTSATQAPAQADDSVDTVIIEMRVWQRVDDAENLWVSARPRGGRWDTLGTIPLPEDGRAWSYGEMGRHGYGDIAMAGVAVRVWQRTHEPERIYVQACAGPCPDRSDRLTRLWRPLGKIPLPLDDGHSPGTRYRYGDIDVAVPRGNPGLLADREHLLALRDVLEGDGEELDWSVDRPTAGWEGITVGGTPPRVTGLNLANHGLTGEIWGYLGDLAELTELRLDGNALTGIIPSKLSLLGNLTHVYLAGNALQGCIPPGLRVAQQNDLSAVSLAECPALDTQTVEGGDSEFPDDFPDLDGWFTDLGGGTHYLALWFSPGSLRTHLLVFDVPPGGSVRIESWEPIGQADLDEPFQSVFEAAQWGGDWGSALWNNHTVGTWLFLSAGTGDEVERSHYSGCVYGCGATKSSAAWIEQLAASAWVNTAISDDREWVWP